MVLHIVNLAFTDNIYFRHVSLFVHANESHDAELRSQQANHLLWQMNRAICLLVGSKHINIHYTGDFSRYQILFAQGSD